MKKLILAITTILIAVLTAQAGVLDVKEVTLSNGLTVWLNQDHSQPKVWGAVVVRAGATDTPNEGIAHYFEHIMFKGTDELGTTDYEKERPLLDSISACYDKLSATNDAAQRAEIQRQINQLSVKAADYAIPNEFNRLINLYGGSGLNAGTGDDFTMYYNTFSPQYMRQWLELNSHRLLNPVFRLFQSELEAVYEEKNMYADQPLATAVETVREAWFGDNPYAFPVIGSTENLKNPQMSKMAEFYKKYYVAPNMALILCGDFEENDVLPYLEDTFGRLPSGDKSKPLARATFTTPRHNGETVKIKLPIPIVKIFALMFDYPGNSHNDEGAMQIAARLLSNESQTGLLDQIITDNKALAAEAVGLPFNNGGIFLCLGVPNLLGKTKTLEKLIWQKFDMLKSGQFSDETFNAARNSLSDSHQRELETLDSRGQAMVETWLTGKSWQQRLAEIAHLQNITRDEVIAAANRYLTTDNYMRLEKKYGKPTPERLQQPGFKPVRPTKDAGESKYALQLKDKYPVTDFQPRLIDINSDAKKTQLGEHANLYTVANNIDSLYTLSVRFYRGEVADPMIEPLMAMFDKMGTQSLTRKEFNQALLDARASIAFDSDAQSVEFTLSGHDNSFAEAVALLADMINNPKADKKSIDDVLDIIKMDDESFESDNTTVMLALISWLRYGDRSDFLTRVTQKQMKKISPEELLSHFDNVKDTQMAVVYSGTLPSEQVEATVRKLLPINQSQPAHDTFRQQLTLQAAEPVIYFYNMKNARQAYVGTYAEMQPAPTPKERETANMWSEYFGGDMSSVMFQELREYRSLGYSCGEVTSYPDILRHADSPGMQLMFVGTQADKTLIAIEALDSIVASMPMSQPNFEAIKSGRLNSVNHNFPNFRRIGNSIANLEAMGRTEDPNKATVEYLPAITLDDIAQYHNTQVKTAPRVYIIVGDKKAIDMKALASKGKVIEVKDTQIYKKK